ncbi:hypothetical protein [Roseovarius ramblicola]|uniref:Mu-like prophage FluMu N-terminal domain-containing protein n=1 Tax=Roseovarius ramblicola TaxID=2022336 RepID=A0ABV5HWV2_9RHOB
MTYRIKTTVIAAKRLAFNTEAEAGEIGTEAEIARLLELGAIEEIEDAEPRPQPELPEMDDVLRAAMIEAIGNLPADGFTSSGKPSVEALEAALPEHADRITAAARDMVWDEMKAAADAAS